MKKTLKLFVLLFISIAITVLLISFVIFKKSNSVCKHSDITVSTVTPNCTAEGKTVHSCNNCSYYYITDITPKSEHKYTPHTVPPTCESEGYIFYFCSCGNFYKTDTVPTLPHTFTDKTVAATCSAGGYVEHSCQTCGYSYKDSETAPAPHSYQAKTVLPTALEVGYTEYTCSCAESYKDAFVEYSEILNSPYVENSSIVSRGIDVSRWNHQIDSASGAYLPLD